MPTSSLFQAHVDQAVADAGPLSAQIVNRTTEQLRSSGLSLAVARDRQEFFSLMEALQRQHDMLVQALTQAMAERILEAARESTPTLVPRHQTLSLDALTLVDEHQAEEDIEVSRTITLIEATAEWELSEVQAYTAALRGEATIRKEANPVRPEVYARALSQAARAIALSQPSRMLLLRTASKLLADSLKTQYAALCRKLSQQGIQPLAFRAVTTPTAPAVRVDITRPGALHGLLDKVRLAPAGSPALPGSGQPAAAAPAAMERAQVEELLSRLFGQILADPRLLTPVKDVLGQLQPSVLRVALRDPALLQQHDHPTWQLLNRVASHCAGYSNPSDERLTDFLRFLQDLIARVTSAPHADAQLYRDALQEVNDYLDARSREALERSRQAMEALQRAEHKERLRSVLRQQVRQMQGRPLSEPLRDFLFGPWVDAMTESLMRHGENSRETAELLRTVDDLLWSVQPMPAPADRERLRAMLPDLLARVHGGLDLIAWPKPQREVLFTELMARHAESLRPPPGAATPAERAEHELTAEELVQRMREESSLLPFDTDEPADRGTLPTVPVGLMTDSDTQAGREAREAWMSRLVPGTWFHLFVQGVWTNAQLMWASDNGQLFMFSSQHAGQSHSLTRRAVERLLGEGLITLLEDRSLVQRAVDSMMQDLDDPA
ncbi:DUF1631 domain-containing protein [Schlegelella sp. S2-27]|uniref:DUF1631 domain-containing protein n=1 Tax=Caldimonas mangrovi TaxID=2944811 RepID=A0ABT0YQ03_9BURK|nr:DUF1631 family protein [Caldimonas mangrovi]MCM5680820.1 DUF1631 domain-containing protein [Caldimonas mangrovi]